MKRGDEVAVVTDDGVTDGTVADLRHGFVIVRTELGYFVAPESDMEAM